MKVKLKRLLSMLLTLSCMVSVLTVFITAPSETYAATQSEESVRLIYYRTYDEGWYLTNGMSITEKENIFAIDNEMSIDYKRNYFWRFTLGSAQDGFAQIATGGSPDNRYVFEFDVKSDDVADFGRIMYLKTTGGKTISLFYISDNKAYAFSEEDGFLFDVDNTWRTVSIVLDGEIYGTEREAYYARVYVDGKLVLERDVEAASFRGLEYVRVGCPGSLDEQLIGTSYCLDNFKIYGGTDSVVEITEEMGHGLNVNENGTIGIVIEGGEDVNDRLGASLAMKLGVKYYFSKGERYPITGTTGTAAVGEPYKTADGTIMVPLEPFLDHMGVSKYIHPDGKYIDISTGVVATYLSIGKSTATVNGVGVDLIAAPGYATAEDGSKVLTVALDDIEKLFEGWYITYDAMGLILFAEQDDIVSRDTDLSAMMDLMCEFIFDYVTPEQAYEDAKGGTDNFSHPYILADENQLDFLRAAYGAEEGDENYDAALKGYITRIVDSAESTYRSYAEPSSVETVDGVEVKHYDSYVGIRGDTTYFNQSNLNNNGYDVGGRSYPVDRTEKCMTLAFGYQMTGDMRYVLLANDIAREMDEWTHWGHGHFLNCADAIAPFAVYYDWCYQANEMLGEQTGEDINAYLASIIYRRGIYPGWRSSMGYPLDHYRAAGDASNYTDRTNNWNAVCSSGMIMGALAILGEEDIAFPSEEGGYERVKEHASFLISNNLECLMRVGLEQYAPDGAYIEGPGYWGYGTNSLFRLSRTLDVAMGTNYGLMDCWGMENTCYYACSIESSDFTVFNYNDCDNQSLGTFWLLYAGQVFGDENLIAIRKTHLKGGKNPSIFDMVAWPQEPLGESLEDVPLDYADYYLEIYTSRSGWEKGEMFIGMMAGDNNVTHGQLDSGSFVYNRNGIQWFYDIGKENYNVDGFWSGANRYRYYVMKPEGNNTIAISSLPKDLPYGQELNSTPYLESTYTNEYGSYAIFEMTEALGPAVMSWKRGVLVTNDRNTVVIQDEIAMPDIHTVYWFGHYTLDQVSDVTISDDGRVAYFTSTDELGNKTYMRATIVSPLSKFKFSLMDCYTFIHTQADTGTFTPDYAATHGSLVPENDRSGYAKLAIKSETLSFNVAVVLEEASAASTLECGYTWTEMRRWEPTADTRGLDGGEAVESKRRQRNPSRTEVLSGIVRINNLIAENGSYTEKAWDMYRLLADMTYVMGKYEGKLDTGNYKEAVDGYRVAAAEYLGYIDGVNGIGERRYGIMQRLFGLG